MDGGAELAADARLLVELSGTVPGNQYDQLQVGGLLSLGGALDVTLLGGFTPRYGDVFDLLDFGALVGRFDAVQLPALDGLTWDTSTLYTAGAITVVPEPSAVILLLCGGLLIAVPRCMHRHRAAKNGFSLAN